jgi:hypothetical protein
MFRLVAALFVLAFLDALSTYVVVAWGLGVEANPAVASIINSNPAAVFPLALISAAVPSAATYVATTLSHMLPARLRRVAVRLMTAAFSVAITWRAAVVVNNTMILLFSRY